MSFFSFGKFLVAFKSHHKQIRKGVVPEELPDDPMDVVALGVSSTKNSLCMKGECNNCKGSSLIDEICKMIQSCDSLISFSKWATITTMSRK